MRGTVFELNRMIEALEAIKHTPEQIAAIVRDELDAHLRMTVAAATTAYGEPWPAGKYGQPLLVNAAAAIQYTINGRKLRVRLTGIEAKHHFGAVRGGRARRIIPNRPYLPQAVYERVIARIQDIVNSALAGAA
jgi:hypothetical protein